MARARTSARMAAVTATVAVLGAAGCGGNAAKPPANLHTHAAATHAPTARVSTVGAGPSGGSDTATGAPSGPPTPATTLAVSAPPPGTGLALRCLSTCSFIPNNRSGFSLLETADASASLTSYDAAAAQLTRIGGDEFTVGCGAADVTVGSRRVLLTEHDRHTSAAGINQAGDTIELQAWDAATGARLWITPLAHFTGDDYSGCGQDSGQNTLASFYATSDGRWGVSDIGGVVNHVVNLSDGTMRRVPSAAGTLGRWLLRDRHNDDEDPYFTADPATLAKIADLPADSVPGGENEPGGLYLQGSVGDSITHALSADSRRVFATVVPDFDYKHAYFAAYSLPRWKRQWKVDVGLHPYLVGDGGGVLVVLTDAKDGSQNMSGLETATGHKLWTVRHFNVVLAGQNLATCGITSTQAMVIANDDQLVTLDLKTGKQVSYEKDPYTDLATGDPACPAVYRTGVGVADGQVMQLLAP